MSHVSRTAVQGPVEEVNDHYIKNALQQLKWQTVHIAIPYQTLNIWQLYVTSQVCYGITREDCIKFLPNL